MNKEYLALFDLDGTLFDTGEVNYYAYKEALEPYNVKLDRNYFVTECNGRHYTEFLPGILGGIEHIETVHELKKKRYLANIDKARANIHLFEMIKMMKEKYHVAIVTTASQKNVSDILKHFGYDSIFELVVTQEDITKVKPDPQGFLMAMKYFDASPECTLIFEDSEVGIQAARATGATVMVIKQF